MSPLRTVGYQGLRAQGFIGSYVLYGIILLAIFGAAYGKIYSARNYAEQVQDTVDRVEAQLIAINARLTACVESEPAAVHGQHSSNVLYPSPPASSDYTDDVANLVCQNGKANRPITEFGYIPLAPPTFEAWRYRNSPSEGVQLILVPRASGAAASERTRLLKRLSQAYAVSNTDALYITLESP